MDKKAHSESLMFAELVNICELHVLCESFTAITGAVTAILDIEGNILIATGWQDICTRFHRVHITTKSRCRESDTTLAGQLKKGEGYNVYKCKNGLVDVAVPIMIAGEHVANFFTGQFFFEPPDKNYFIQQAEEFGFDKTEYLAALSRVPIFSENQVRTMMNFFSRLARLIGEMGVDRKNMEDRVEQRTTDLRNTNEQLQREIFEHKRAEEALCSSEVKYRNLVEKSSDWVWTVDQEGRYTYSNPKVWNILGYKPKEIIGKTPFDLMPPEEVSEIADIFSGYVAAHEPFSGLVNINLHKDGRQVVLETSAEPVFDGGGIFIGYLGIDRDITKRIQAEEALRESEIKFRTLFESASDAIFLMDQNVFIDCNQKALEMFGGTRGQIIGQTPYRFSPEVQPDGRNSLEIAQEKIEAAMRGQPQFGEWKHCRYDGTLFDAEVSLNVVRAAGKNYLQATVHDITERKSAEEKIQYLATHDSLTDLPNRLMFSQLLNHAIQAAQRYKRQLAVFFIDLDRFKIINDTLGHEAGDKLLQEVATRLRQSLRAVDVIARLGGDEFVILIEEIKDLEQVATVARNVLSTVIKPMAIMDQECRVTASIGISIYPKAGMDEQSLMKNADIAMYFAKAEGKNNYQFYSKDIKAQSIERFSVETNLREALQRNELFLHYQAKLDFRTGAITGVEALLRWQNPSLGSVSPLQLIPVAEETGLIIPIGRWVMKTACAQNVAWQNQGLPPVCMAVNLSLRQLTDGGLLEDIRTALDESGMEPNLLELEITESMVMHNPKRMVKVLSKIKDLGVRLAIDDFGTGYSSLSQLKHFPVDTLKVDRSFIRNIPDNAEDKAITEAIIAMGKTLRLTVVAEGVETQEQMDFLQEHSCDEMQGFYFSKPVVPERFADLQRKHILK